MRCIPFVKKRIMLRFIRISFDLSGAGCTGNLVPAAKVEKNIKEFFIGGDSLPSLLIAVCT
jgi:hypothetical protein